MATVIACLILIAVVVAAAIEVANRRTLAKMAEQEAKYQAKRVARMNRQTKKILAAKAAKEATRQAEVKARAEEQAASDEAMQRLEEASRRLAAANRKLMATLARVSK